MPVTHLERRKIEAGVLIPMLQAFQRALGQERANDIAREVIRELALPELGALFHCSRDFAMSEG